ncbi:MAG: ABC transporter permease [Oscillospiraceae bacterium]|nr:ABC transporter permease [Oscillospiraceae bacterium]
MKKNAGNPERRRKRNAFINRDTWRRFKKNKASLVGLILFLIFVLFMIFADVIVPYSVAIENNISQRLQPPSAEHWFGTDAFGRDVLARIIHASRYSLLMGIVSVVIGIVCGSVLAAIAGLYGGIADRTIMLIMDTILCIPFMLLALAIVAALGSGLENLLMALVIASVPIYVRVIRSSILTVVESDFVEAARSLGTPDRWIVLKHILPNAIGTIIVQATMSVGTMITWAAALSYVGMGIQPPAPEWGAMLSEGKNYMLQYPYLVIFPGLAIVLCCLSLNLMGDGLRDALDPKLKD